MYFRNLKVRKRCKFNFLSRAARLHLFPWVDRTWSVFEIANLGQTMEEITKTKTGGKN